MHDDLDVFKLRRLLLHSPAFQMLPKDPNLSFHPVCPQAQLRHVVMAGHETFSNARSCHLRREPR